MRKGAVVGLTPVVAFAMAFGAGLVTGLLRFWDPWPAVACVAATLLLRRHDASLVPLAGLIGVLHGTVARAREETRCATRIPAGAVAVLVQLVEPVRDRVGEARLPGSRCSGSITLRWPDLDAARPAGASLVVTGTWIAQQRSGGRADGVLVVRSARDTAGPEATAAMRVRTALVESAGRLFGARAALVDALVLGRRSGLDPELREAFVRAGLAHLLAISGLHVGLLSAWVVLLLRWLGVRRAIALGWAALGALGYVAFLGFPPPATRAGMLGLLLAYGYARQRRVQPGALLAMCCLLVALTDPWAVLEVGAWLSAAAIWGLTVAIRWCDRALGPTSWWRPVAASFGATIATAPITAWVFGSVAGAGVVLNVVALPLAGVAVPGIALALATDQVFHPAATVFATGAGLALALLERIAMIGSQLPGPSWYGEPRSSLALLAGAALVVAVWMISGRATARVALRRAAWVAVLAAWLWLIAGSLGRLGGGDGELTLFMLDVGQGDATAIRTPRGRWVLVDAGPAWRRADAGRRVVGPFLARHGARRVELLVLSHAHLDHLGGAPAVLDRVGVGAVLEPALPVPDSAYLALLDRIAAAGVPWHPARAGQSWELDGVRFRVLHPDTLWQGWQESLNEDSLVLVVEYGAFRALLAGDAGLPTESALAGRVGVVDLLKAGHHGSATATGAAWLAELRPKAVVVSLGQNRYGHPAPVTLARVREAGATVWRTDRDGTVRTRTDGRQVEIRAGGRVETFTAADSIRHRAVSPADLRSSAEGRHAP
jgi:competence protein ComEC